MQEESEDRECRDLVELIKRRGGHITIRQLMRAARRYRDDADKAEEALNRLVKRKLASCRTVEPESQGGRPYVVWDLV
jgi:hypothetical protein